MAGFSDKQRSIMKVVIEGNDDGSCVDFDQLMERINYETTKASMQFSLRALIRRGYLVNGEREKRRGRQRRVIEPTKNARRDFDAYLPFVAPKEAP